MHAVCVLLSLAVHLPVGIVHSVCYVFFEMWKQVTVAVHRDRDRTVAHSLFHGQRVCACCNQQGCISVSQVMETGLRGHDRLSLVVDALLDRSFEVA